MARLRGIGNNYLGTRRRTNSGKHRAGKYDPKHRQTLFGGDNRYKGRHRPTLWGALTGRQVSVGQIVSANRAPGRFPGFTDMWGGSIYTSSQSRRSPFGDWT